MGSQATGLLLSGDRNAVQPFAECLPPMLNSPPIMPTPNSRQLNEKARNLFRQWGREGGKKRAERLSKSQQSEIARKAALARWKRTA